MLRPSHHRVLTYLLLSALLVSATGCWHSKKPFRFEHDGNLEYYQGVALEIEQPADHTLAADSPHSEHPRALQNPQDAESWNLTLEEVIRIALANSDVLRTLGGSVLQNPESRQTDLDPAIIETSPLFGVEAALSDFDAKLSVLASWERRDRPVNVSPGAGLIFAPVQKQEGALFNAGLTKIAATGTNFAIRNNVNYDANNSPTHLFGSAWDVNYELEARHPFLQGSGVDFNRIAGPNSTVGNPNGVLLARLRTDISLTDFERGVRNFVSDVENAYWELYFSYRDLDAKVTARNEALETWQDVEAFRQAGDPRGGRQEAAQARSQYFQFQVAVDNALSGTRNGGTITAVTGGTFSGIGGVYGREANLRFLMGLAPNDGRLIVPANQPMTAAVVFDWHAIIDEARARRVELRRQQWVIESRELELIAARNYLLPRLDALALYRWRGLGNDLIHPTRKPGLLPSAYQTLTGGNFQEWQLGFQLDVPIGYRREAAAVRNAELQLAREHAILHNQELELVHQLDGAIREVERAQQVIQTSFNRLEATVDDLDAINETKGVGQAVLVDEILRAQQRKADAEVEFHRAVIAYNLAIKNVHFQKGSLLQYNGVVLAEGPWTEEAHMDAMARSRYFHSRHVDYRITRPGIISDGRYHQQQLRDDLDLKQRQGGGADDGTPPPESVAPPLPQPPPMQ